MYCYDSIKSRLRIAGWVGHKLLVENLKNAHNLIDTVPHLPRESPGEIQLSAQDHALALLSQASQTCISSPKPGTLRQKGW